MFGGNNIYQTPDVPSERILYVANSLVQTLLLSFVEPLKQCKHIESSYLTEAELISGSGEADEWRSNPAVTENLERLLAEFKPTLIVFCRYSGPCSKEIISWARAAGTPTIYQIDDDLLNVPKEIGEAKARSHNQPRRTNTVRYLLDEATVVYCSTEKLRRRLFGDATDPRVIVGDIYCASEILAPPTTEEPPVIGYMGLGSHDYDFTFALPAVIKILDARPDVCFEIFGSVRVAEELKRFGDRIRHIEPIPDYGSFLQKLASLRWTIGICPLAKTPFNEVKANTKWVEYSACGFAVVASRGLVYDECCADACGILADGDEEWFAAFDKLLGDKDFHRTQVERAQRRVREDFSRDRLRGQIFSVFSHAHARAAQSSVTKLALDELVGNDIWGWAWSSTETPDDQERPAVELWSGDVLLGRLSRRCDRPDVDAYLETPAWPKGFSMPAGCLNALCLLMGGEDSGLHPTLRFSGQTSSIYTCSPRWRDLGSYRTLRSAQGPKGWKVADLWWGNTHLLKARASYAPYDDGRPETRLIRIFQPARRSDGTVALMSADQFEIKDTTAVYSFGLRNPFMPILLIGYNDSGEISFTDLIVFPSLLRGGPHASELSVVEEGDGHGGLAHFCRVNDAYLAELLGWGSDLLPLSIGAIGVNLLNATGAEPIFDKLVLEWLTLVFSLQVEELKNEQRLQADLGDRTFVDHIESLLSCAKSVSPRRGLLRLSLPSSALPTIGVLAARRISQPHGEAPATFIVTDEALPDRRYLVSIPATMPGAVASEIAVAHNDFPILSPLGVAGGEETDHMRAVAILFRDMGATAKDLLLYPVPRDERLTISSENDNLLKKISLFITISEADLDLRLFLNSIATQATSAELEVFLVVSNCSEREIGDYRKSLDEAFPNNSHIVEVSSAFAAVDGLNRAGALATGEIFVYLDCTALLFDQRTLHALCRLASVEGVGTVGCMHLKRRTPSDQTPVFQSAGYFPSRADFAAAPAIAINEMDCGALLANAIYPVAANSSHLYAVSATAWQQAGGMNPHFRNDSLQIDLALRLARLGFVNICTTLTAVFVEAENQAKYTRDLGVASLLTLPRLLPALTSSTLIRAF